MLQLLHVDDNVDDLEITKLRLEELSGDLRIEWSLSAKEALERIRSTDYHCVLCDYKMPGMDGLELLQELRSSGNNIPFILLTGQPDEGLVDLAFDLGADDYYTKAPGFAHYRRLLASIVRSVESKRLLLKYHESWVALLERVKKASKIT